MISHFNLEVKPGVDLAKVVNVTGSIFVCKESSAPFLMQFDNSAKFPCEGGFSLRVPDGFRRVTFFNQSATTKLTVNFYAGDAQVSFDYLRNPKTRLKATAQTLAPGATKEFSGVDAGNRRKSILITNTHASQDVQVIDNATNVAMATIYGNKTYQIDTDADICVLNPAGNTVNIRVEVAELFYVT